MNGTNIDILRDIHTALSGVCSECGVEEFDHFYRGGGAKMFGDFEKALHARGGILRGKHIDIVCGVYTALSGYCSELGDEALDHFYRGGGKKLFCDFEGVLRSYGVKIVKPEFVPYEYYDRTMKRKMWAVVSDINDPENSYALSGLPSKEAAEEAIRMYCGTDAA